MNDTAPPERGSAFDEIYRAHQLQVRRHLVYLTGDTSLAEDLTQEAFGKLYERQLGDDAEQLRNPGGWLLTVASNLAYNYFRAESRRTAREESASAATAASDLDDVLDVRRALAELEPRDRTVLMLRHSGFSYAEIAEAVSVAPTSVGTILARSQRRFREVYEGAAPRGDEEE